MIEKNVCPFDFYTSIRTLVLYSTACDWRNFDHLYKLRVQLEIGFWEEAVSGLGNEDKQELLQILERAEAKLKGKLVEIPHREHRNFHLLIYSRLDNTFTQGLLKEGGSCTSHLSSLIPGDTCLK